eukprot:m.107055 g.107055  ORF g.107055 m.107055 type:complete len:285 (-) comp21130_c0_seq4:71-925(-)
MERSTMNITDACPTLFGALTEMTVAQLKGVANTTAPGEGATKAELSEKVLLTALYRRYRTLEQLIESGLLTQSTKEVLKRDTGAAMRDFAMFSIYAADRYHDRYPEYAPKPVLGDMLPTLYGAIRRATNVQLERLANSSTPVTGTNKEALIEKALLTALRRDKTSIQKLINLGGFTKTVTDALAAGRPSVDREYTIFAEYARLNYPEYMSGSGAERTPERPTVTTRRANSSGAAAQKKLILGSPPSPSPTSSPSLRVKPESSEGMLVPFFIMGAIFLWVAYLLR